MMRAAMSAAASSASAALACEIVAQDAARASALAAIAEACARDVGQRLTVKIAAAPASSGARRAATASLLTLHLPAALAAAQHPVWCLACRLACFCPETRVSVLVRCVAEFAPRPARARRRRAA
jgi:hypothetical protein